MTELIAAWTFVLGLTLRLGLPLAGTALVVVLLRRLDRRWQAEAEQQNAAPGAAESKHCWEFNQCAEERRAECPAFLHPETPCFQHFRAANGDVRQSCLACELFRNVGKPAPATVQVSR